MKTLKFLVLVISASIFSQAQTVYDVNRKIIGADNQRVVNAMGTNVPFKYHPAMEAIGVPVFTFNTANFAACVDNPPTKKSVVKFPIAVYPPVVTPFPVT